MLKIILINLVTSWTRVEARCTPSSKPPVLPLGNCTVPGTNVDTTGIPVELHGTAHCLMPSLFVNNTLLMDSILCADGHRTPGESTREVCETRLGKTVDVSTLGPSYVPGNVGDLKADDPNWKNLQGRSNITTLEAVYGTVGLIDMGLPDGITLNKVPVAIINQGEDHNVGHLGLGPFSTFLKALGVSGMTPAFGFGLDVGSQSVSKPRAGSLVPNGYDAASPLGSWHTYPINHNPPEPGERICPLQVVIEELTIDYPNGSVSENLLGNGPSRLTPSACVEPYDNYPRLPSSIFNAFANAIGWSKCCQDVAAGDDIYIVEPGLLFPSNMSFTGSLKLTLSDGFVVEIPNEELVHPLRGIDRTGKRVLRNNLTEISVFRSVEAPLSKMALGKTFLSSLYLVVDYKADHFRLARRNPDALAPDPVPLSPRDTSQCDNQFDGKTIGFTVSLVVLGIAIIVLASMFWWTHKHAHAPQPKPSSPPPNGPTVPKVFIPMSALHSETLSRPSRASTVPETRPETGTDTPAGLGRRTPREDLALSGSFVSDFSR